MNTHTLQRPSMPFVITAILDQSHDEYHNIVTVQTDLGKFTILLNEINQVMGWKKFDN